MATIKARLEKVEQRAGGNGKNHFPQLLLVTDREEQAAEIEAYKLKYRNQPGLILYINKPGEA